MDNAQARNIAMDKAIDLAALLSDDAAGELLREMCFDGESGCYTNFDLIPGFIKLEPADLSLGIRTALAGCFANSPDNVRGMQAFQHDRTKMTIAWYWDGDGTLVFKTDAFMLSNTDCKKDYGWRRTGSAGWTGGESYYEFPELVRPQA